MQRPDRRDRYALKSCIHARKGGLLNTGSYKTHQSSVKPSSQNWMFQTVITGNVDKSNELFSLIPRSAQALITDHTALDNPDKTKPDPRE
jgi:hypothetical protein